MLHRALLTSAVLAAIVMSAASDVRAQGSGGSSGGVSTVTAQSTSSTSSGTGSSGSQSGTGSSQAGGTFGGSSTGAGGQGGAAGQGGVQGPQFTQFGQGAATPASGFVGRGNTGTFVGNTAASQPTVNSGAFSNFGGAGGGRVTTTPATVSEARGSQMRIPQRIAFAVAPIAPLAIQLKLQTQFSSLEQTLPGVSAQVDPAGIVTLQGTVGDADARSLAEALALLEPGVVQVNNELVVAP